MQEVRQRLIVQGQVQGVGFRPFIYKLAHTLSLTGHVLNTSDGVQIEIQGAKTQTETFLAHLQDAEKLPALAKISSIAVHDLSPIPAEEDFAILMSHGEHGHNVLISPDVGICDECLAEMRDPSNRRYRYPFTNCTNCGPRYTITKSIPYDRAVTTMACFPMCPDCAQEYADPLDRRFHAQPIACNACSPHVWFVNQADKEQDLSACTPQNSKDPFGEAADALLAGQIIAIKGLGGFQLACDALNPQSLSILRQRKRRPHKAFALMVQDIETLRTICVVSPESEKILSSPARPALILDPRPDEARLWQRLIPIINPDTDTLAFMLPTTPLHIVLFDILAERCQRLGKKPPVLIMTSGNVSGTPLCTGNREAVRRLGSIADGFLLHDRDILCRVDDSVLAYDILEKRQVFFRRARGYVPSPIELCIDSSACAMGTGADLKATFCLTKGKNAFISQHIGDIENPETEAFYGEAIYHLKNLLQVEPDIVVTDLHPNFFSTYYGENLAQRNNIPLIKLQHHVAHAAAVLAEYHVHEPALALVLDGTGYGPDRTIWGGELLKVDLSQKEWQRLGSLSPFPLPGGEVAIQYPWRIALGLSQQNCTQYWRQQRGSEVDVLREIVNKGLNSPLTSSCGRLFDAVSAQLGICSQISYEGQAAIRLEKYAKSVFTSKVTWKKFLTNLKEEKNPYSDVLPASLATALAPQASIISTDAQHLDSYALFDRVWQLQQENIPRGFIALDFHLSLAQGLAILAERHADSVKTIALAGGVINNYLMRNLLASLLKNKGFTVLIPQLAPPGDGGLCLGQAIWGLLHLQ